MSKTKSKVVDLELSSDGTYSTKDTLNIRKIKPLKGMPNHTYKDVKPKFLMRNDADEFLSGIDMGLDLLDNIVPRVDRFLKLRG